MKLSLNIIEGVFTIHRFAADDPIEKQVLESSFFNICKTDEELSIVCSSSVQLDSPVSESGWSCIKVLGPLDFSLTGILADLSAILARKKISIFAVSTFDTDYILIKSDTLESAVNALEGSGYKFK